MKKFLNSLLILILMVGVMLPTLAYAEGEEDKEEETTEETATAKEAVTVYMFRGETCPHCEEALEWFNSEEVQKEYGSHFKLETYEVWNDANNADLMEKVARFMGDDPDDENKFGVPYILIGKHTVNGFASSDADQLISWIEEEYAKDPADRYLALEEYEKAGQKDTTARDVIIVISFVVIVAGIVFVTIKARKGE